MHFLVIGGGFVGCAIACHLLAAAPAGSTISLVNAGSPLARGLAYGTQSPLHMLNVPAARMAWTDAAPDDFTAWLAQHLGPEQEGGAFVQRHLYGEYLAARLHEHVASRSDLDWQHRQARIESLVPQAEGGWTALMADGTSIAAEHVFLALGNFKPACPHRNLAELPAGRYADDPWQPGATQGLSPDAPVALIGTGLTMLDQLLSLDAAGHRGQVLAISRRGLLPQPHRSNELPPPGWAPPRDWPGKPALGVAELTRQVRASVANAVSEGHDWRDVWVALRSRTATLWQGLTPVQRAQFLRHLQPFWDVHRHRAAPTALELLVRLRAEGRLRVVAGRLLKCDADSGAVHLRWQPRNGGEAQSFEAARVFNCTGPSSRIDRDRAPLFAALQDAGRLRVCELGLGVHTDASYRLLDATGAPQAGLYYVGPMLKSQHWEATAVPELRRHAQAAVAGALRSHQRA
ncbi:MAG TPA: FAD/NAD(P)-binding protein [Burkholderiaceae bacterium]